MNFKPTKAKSIASITISFLIAFSIFIVLILSGIKAELINYPNIASVFPLSAIIIYTIWSLFEK